MGAFILWQKLSYLFESKYEMDTVDGQSLYKIGCAFQSAMIDFLADYTVPSCKASDNEAAKNVNVSLRCRVFKKCHR